LSKNIIKPTTQNEFRLKALVRQRSRLTAFKIQLKRQDEDIRLKEQSIKGKINSVYGNLEKQVEKQIKKIEDQLKQFDQATQKLLETIPGVGPITAVSFVSEISRM